MPPKARRRTPKAGADGEEEETECSESEMSEAEKQKKPAATLLVDEDKSKKMKTFWTRFIGTWVMISSFFLIIAAGHFYCMLLVLFLITAIFKELLAIKRKKEREHNIPYFRVLNWYFFTVTLYYVLSRALQFHLDQLSLRQPLVQLLADRAAFKAFSLYILGFVTFVLTLKKGNYKYQFSQFGWGHMVLLFITVTSSFFVHNIYAGLIWFFLPCGMIICNDVMAYMFGFFFGRTPLISLSPKKTWEGFLGAFVSTLVFGFVLSMLLAPYPFFTCPQSNLSVVPFTEITCDADPVFQFQPYTLPSYLGGGTFQMMPVQLHSLALGTFSSLLAPFGGFFASGFKRATKIKDFGDTIPGHGGFTDRMDCQIMMSLFTYVYRLSFVNYKVPSIASILSRISLLSSESQLELYNQLSSALTERGLLGQ